MTLLSVIKLFEISFLPLSHLIHANFIVFNDVTLKSEAILQTKR